MEDAITVLRWIARLLSVALVVLFCIFLIGEGPPPFFPLTLQTIASLLLLLALAGLLIALRAEALGGILGLAGSAGFYLTDFAASGFHQLPGGWIFPLLLIAPMLHLLVWWRRRTAHHETSSTDHQGMSRVGQKISCPAKVPTADYCPIPNFDKRW
jgi:hypothetical protein